ncbi:flavin reductase [Skermania sp. ID1734]|uniref:flavin reductase family protein n=1 Tax=Skermania sp. ID1734 TaxID=2597516 RepID=UPI00117F2E82|nr:flavin reductase family protein [Skermania sp. ID1734]TSE01685.1 flavin reductase [Skermania sp. ID1734]
MWVVTAREAGERTGCLVGFASQASIDPPRFVVCLSMANHTYRVAKDAERLAVHILGRDHIELARLFGSETGDEVDKFAQCAWHDGPDGLPILDAAAGWFCGRVVDRFPLGDHVGFLLAPYAGESPRTPLNPVSFTDVRDLDPGHPA